MTTVLPGGAVGILWCGQLGRMLALAARRLDYRVVVFGPGAGGSPAGQVADGVVDASYDDQVALRTFASRVDVVTFEFENVPAATAEAVTAIRPLRPGVAALAIAQDRLVEKQFLRREGLPVTPFAPAGDAAELAAAGANVGWPAIAKTRRSGYDGKGQARLDRPEQAAAVWNALGRPLIVEAAVPLRLEVSVVAARDVQGRIADYGVIENHHVRGILDLSSAPAAVSSQTVQEARAMAAHILEALDLVGVLCAEFFITADDRLLVNEIAPRPHNSGHLTIEAALTGQFEQQLRTVCGLPPGDTTLVRPAAMANLLGDLWSGGQPPLWNRALDDPAVRLHLYGKREARPGRKMGHLTALATTVPEARARVCRARERLAQEF